MSYIQELLYDLSKNVEVLRNRDGQPLLKVECAIQNIIETYDGYAKQFLKGADNIE